MAVADSGQIIARPKFDRINLQDRFEADKRSRMKTIPEEMLADAKEIRKAIKSLRAKSTIENLVRRGVAPERIERTIKDAEAAAEAITDQAKSRIEHRKRAKLKIVKA